MASDTRCEIYQQEAEILAVQTKERIKFSEAKRIVLSRRVRPSKTYANAVNMNRQQNGSRDPPDTSNDGITDRSVSSNTDPADHSSNLDDVSLSPTLQTEQDLIKKTVALNPTSSNNTPTEQNFITPEEVTSCQARKRTASASSLGGTSKKSLLSDFPMPPNMPAHPPPRPACSRIPTVGTNQKANKSTYQRSLRPPSKS